MIMKAKWLIQNYDDLEGKDLIPELEKQGIDTSVFPSSIADQMREQLEKWVQWGWITNTTKSESWNTYTW